MDTLPSSKLLTDKHTLLFRVSSEEFAASGFKRASLNSIISKVGMSKSSFYHYFKNKTDLFRQTLEYVIRPMLDAHRLVDLDAMTAETLWPELMQMTVEMTRFVNKAPEMLIAGRMFYRCYEDPDDRKLTQDILADFTLWVGHLIQRGQTLGVFRTDIPDTLLIDLLMALGISMDRWMLTHWDEYNEDARMRLSQTGFEILVQLVSPPPAR